MESPVQAPKAKGKEQIEVLNFSDENWRSIQRTWCEQPEKLNRAWKQTTSGLKADTDATRGLS
jgi:hypothetical protein